MGLIQGVDPLLWGGLALLALFALVLALGLRRRVPQFRVVKRALLTENEKEFL